MTKSKYTYALGRRKSSVCTVRLYQGKGSSEVNQKPVDKYFPLESDKITHAKPFVLTDNKDKYYFVAKVNGGGKKGQLQALRLALSRALKKINPDFTSILRKAGLLTVDSRVRERRMVGTGGKSRRQKQSPRR
jgi:small subunit ribosomal protein S9